MRHSAFLLAALLAFVWQSFATQTHVHPHDATPAAAHALTASGTARTVSAGHSKTPGDASGCLLCHELALSGLYIAPAPVTFTPPVPARLWQAGPKVLTGHPQPRSHIWRSRAPPAALQG